MEINGFILERTPRLLSGLGSVNSLIDDLARQYTRIALITGGASFDASGAEEIVNRSGIAGSARYPVTTEPTAAIVDEIVASLRRINPDLILAIGGGSVLDSGKAVAAMLTMSGSVEAYLEGVGDSTPTGSRLPLALVPTTAGTGSEATMNAVISRIGPGGYKKSLRHRNYVPDYAALDPTLHTSTPRQVVSAAGLDAITQLIEAFVSTAASPLSDAYAVQGLLRAGSFERILLHGGDEASWNEMGLAAYCGGVALANAGLGIVHGIASPLGAIRNAPHGAICAALIPGAIRVVCTRLRQEDGEREKQGFAKYAEAGRLLSGRRDSTVDGVDLLTETIERFSSLADVETLGELGFGVNDFDDATRLASLKNTPGKLEPDEVRAILDEAT